MTDTLKKECEVFGKLYEITDIKSESFWNFYVLSKEDGTGCMLTIPADQLNKEWKIAIFENTENAKVRINKSENVRNWIYCRLKSDNQLDSSKVKHCVLQKLNHEIIIVNHCLDVIDNLMKLDSLAKELATEINFVVVHYPFILESFEPFKIKIISDLLKKFSK